MNTTVFTSVTTNSVKSGYVLATFLGFNLSEKELEQVKEKYNIKFLPLVFSPNDGEMNLNAYFVFKDGNFNRVITYCYKISKEIPELKEGKGFYIDKLGNTCYLDQEQVKQVEEGYMPNTNSPSAITAVGLRQCFKGEYNLLENIIKPLYGFANNIVFSEGKFQREYKFSVKDVIENKDNKFRPYNMDWSEDDFKNVLKGDVSCFDTFKGAEVYICVGLQDYTTKEGDIKHKQVIQGLVCLANRKLPHYQWVKEATRVADKTFYPMFTIENGRQNISAYAEYDTNESSSIKTTEDLPF